MLQTPSKTIIFFDIDDTLYESSKFRVIVRKSSISAMNKSLRRFGFNFSDQFLYEEFEKVYQKDKNSPKMYDNLLLNLNIPKNQISLHVAIAKRTWDETKYNMKPFEDVIKTLEYLQKKGYVLGIASAGIGVKQWDKLVRIGIYEFFNPEHVFMTSEVNDNKREFSKDELFYKQIKNSNPENKFETFYMIGDKIKQDIEPANKTGFKTIFFNTKKISTEDENILKSTNTPIIKSYEEIKNLF